MKPGVVNTAPASAKRRPPQARESECTCTIRTRLASLADLIRAMPMLVREDGKLFIPAHEAPVQVGDSVSVVFTTFDGGASIERDAVVESTNPDAAYFGGQAGILFLMSSWNPPPIDPEQTTPPPSAPEDDETRNPFAGLDTHMLSLFVDCNLKETENELSRSYDDIPSFVAPTPAVPSESPRDARSATETLEVLPIAHVEAEVGAQSEVDEPDAGGA